MSDEDVAAAIGADPAAVSHRIRIMVEDGVILGYRARIDLASIGRHVQALISVRIRTSDDHVVDNFREWVTSAPETVGIFVTSGGTDFVVHVAVRRTDDLYSFVVDQLSRQPGVLDARTSLVFEHLSMQVLDPVDDDTSNRHHRDVTPSAAFPV